MSTPETLASLPTTTNTANQTTNGSNTFSAADKNEVMNTWNRFLLDTTNYPKTQAAFRQQYNAYHPNKQLTQKNLSRWITKFNATGPTIAATAHSKSEHKASMASVLRMYYHDLKQRKEGMDIFQDAHAVQITIRRLKDHIDRNPDLVPGFKPFTPTPNYAHHWMHDHKDLIHGLPPSDARAEEITSHLRAHRAPDSGNVTELTVYFDPEHNHYGLRAERNIPKGTLIDEYRGTHLEPDSHLFNDRYDTTYVWEYKDPTTKTRLFGIDATHPYSSFARYCNEKLGVERTDNARLSWNPTTRTLQLKARERIPALTPITVAYSAEYWIDDIRAQILPQELHTNILNAYDESTPMRAAPKSSAPPRRAGRPRLHHQQAEPHVDDLDDDDSSTYVG